MPHVVNGHMNITWKVHITLVAVLASASCVPLAAQSYTFESISCDGYTPAPYGMNGAGTVVGMIPGGGFIYSNGKCQTYPGVAFSGITDTGGLFVVSFPPDQHTYLLESDGHTIGPLPDFPGALGAVYCCADTLTGTLAGNYTPAGSPIPESGFFYQNGKLTSLPWSTASGSPSYWLTLAALNNTGIAVGTCECPTFLLGFVLQKGKITYVRYPEATFTSFGGLNDNGVVVGTFVNQKTGAGGIFTYNIGTATWTELNFPSPYNGLVPLGISNSGVVALVSGGIGYNGLVIATPTTN
jgi:hypothetical protein